MKNTELAELILNQLYELSESQGYDKLYDITAMGQALGVEDKLKIRSVMRVLEDNGLIAAQYGGGMLRASIRGEGSILVENGGDTGVIGRYKQNPGAFLVSLDQSLHIHGDVSNSNVATHSTNLKQGTPEPSICAILNSIELALKRDQELLDKRRGEALEDVDLIRRELVRESPRPRLLKEVLSSLGDVASISSWVVQLGQFLG